MKRMVCGFAFTSDGGQVALILKDKPDWQAGKWNGIGGKIEADETPEQAMSRKFWDEAGVSIKPDQWTEIVTLRGDDWEVTFFYCLHDDVRNVTTTREKELVALCRPFDLPENVIHNLRWLIPLALDVDIRKPLGLRGLPLT